MITFTAFNSLLFISLLQMQACISKVTLTSSSPFDPHSGWFCQNAEGGDQHWGGPRVNTRSIQPLSADDRRRSVQAQGEGGAQHHEPVTSACAQSLDVCAVTPTHTMPQDTVQSPQYTQYPHVCAFTLILLPRCTCSDPNTHYASRYCAVTPVYTIPTCVLIHLNTVSQMCVQLPQYC